MSIKSDKWIKQQAINSNLIDPFEPEQVRNIDGQIIFSFGVSS